MFPFFFGNNFIKKKETFKSFSPQLLEDYRILGNRMAKGYQFDTKWVCPMGSYAWDIQVFCSRNEVAPQYLWRKNLEGFPNFVKIIAKEI